MKRIISLLLFLCALGQVVNAQEGPHPLLRGAEIVKLSPIATVFRLHSEIPQTGTVVLYTRMKTSDKILYTRVVSNTGGTYTGSEIPVMSVVLKDDPKIWQPFYGDKVDFQYAEIRLEIPEQLTNTPIQIELFASNVTEATFHLAPTGMSVEKTIDELQAKQLSVIRCDAAMLTKTVFDPALLETKYQPLLWVFNTLEFIIPETKKETTEKVVYVNGVDNGTYFLLVCIASGGTFICCVVVGIITYKIGHKNGKESANKFTIVDGRSFVEKDLGINEPVGPLGPPIVAAATRDGLPTQSGGQEESELPPPSQEVLENIHKTKLPPERAEGVSPRREVPTVGGANLEKQLEFKPETVERRNTDSVFHIAPGTVLILHAETLEGFLNKKS